MDDGPESGSCASKMAIEVFRKRLHAAGGLFPSSFYEGFSLLGQISFSNSVFSCLQVLLSE